MAMEKSNWLLQHPKLLQMNAYGFDNAGQSQAALQVYLDLAEVKLWHTVSIFPCVPLKLVYLRTQQHQDEPLMCVLPLPASTTLSAASFHDFFQAINDSEQQHLPSGGHHPHTRLVLALVDSDSTGVYYLLHEGIQPPTAAPLSLKHK